MMLKTVCGWKIVKPFIGNLSNTDLYIGQNAGKRIDGYIRNAKKSVRIISPYIAESKYNNLLEKSREGLYVALLTSDDKRHFRTPASSTLLKNVVHQKRHTDEKKQHIRKWIRMLLPLTIILLLSTLLLILLSSKGVIAFEVDKQYLMLELFAMLIIWILQKSMRIYTYSYETPFPVRFVVDPMRMNPEQRKNNPNNAFFHVKLFIIDDEIAFLGSVNLTNKGMRYNFESCITVENKKDISLLAEYFDELFSQNYWQKDLAFYGRLIYKEPIN